MQGLERVYVFYYLGIGLMLYFLVAECSNKHAAFLTFQAKQNEQRKTKPYFSILNLILSESTFNMVLIS